VIARLAALLLGVVATVSAALADTGERNALWAVQGEHNTVYLLGSIHVLRPGDGTLPRAALEAYADAERLVMEIDLDDPQVADPTALLGTMQRAALLPEGESLRGVLGDDYVAIASRAREAGLDLAVLDRFAPWFVATMLLQLELAQRGFQPELGIEQQLADRAARDGKPIEGLETAEQQFALLAGLPLAEQKRFLMMSLGESERLDAEIEDLLAAWRAGDADALEEMLSAAFEEFPELYGPLTEDRNRAWVNRLGELLDDRDDYLVVVGALHLVGRHSVVDLLRQRGYKVTQQ
jgi:uncharacterized protein YbaP (TraB family)